MNANQKDAIARSNLYGLLALGFGHTNAEQYAQIVAGTFQHDVMCCITQCMLANEVDADIMADGLSLVGSSLEDFEAEYLNSFHTNLPAPSASLYESNYTRNIAKASILLELRAFYENFGLAIADNYHELEDNLTGELEFMHFLAAKEAQCMDEELNVEPYVLAQHDFVSRHLAVWIPEFHKDVAKKSMTDFYRTLAQITDLLVSRDAERLSHVRSNDSVPCH